MKGQGVCETTSSYPDSLAPNTHMHAAVHTLRTRVCTRARILRYREGEGRSAKKDRRGMEGSDEINTRSTVTQALKHGKWPLYQCF